MDDNELRKLLHQLHEEIDQTSAVDEKGIKLLRDLKGDIQELLERSESATGQEQINLTKNLQGSLEHFEVTHPTLTATISKLLDFLSNTGI